MIEPQQILIPLLATLVLNTAFFAIAYSRQTDKFTDFTYGLSFVAVVGVGWLMTDHVSVAKIMISLMVGLWAFRIISFLVYRIHQMGRDRRFDSMRASLLRFGTFWFVQAIIAWLVAMPAFLVITYNGDISMQPASWLAALVFTLGLGIETTADLQKLRFSARKTGKFIDEGLWRLVRHPNYLGEVIIWIGVANFAASLGIFNKIWQVALVFTSPILIFLILRFFSGVPRLQAYAEKKWGKTKSYQQYKARTGLFLPKPWAWFKN